MAAPAGQLAWCWQARRACAPSLPHQPAFNMHAATALGAVVSKARLGTLAWAPSRSPAGTRVRPCHASTHAHPGSAADASTENSGANGPAPTHLCGHLARVDANGGTPRLLQIPAPAGANAGALQVSRRCPSSSCIWEGQAKADAASSRYRHLQGEHGGALCQTASLCKPNGLAVAAPLQCEAHASHGVRGTDCHALRARGCRQAQRSAGAAAPTGSPACPHDPSAVTNTILQLFPTHPTPVPSRPLTA